MKPIFMTLSSEIMCCCSRCYRVVAGLGQERLAKAANSGQGIEIRMLGGVAKELMWRIF
jgi:hypothetical protein